MKHSPAWTALRILLLVVIWGASFSVYKVALNYSPPLLFAGVRTFLGGVILAVFAWPQRHQIRWKQSWPVYVISALFNVVLFFGLQTVGLSYLPAGLFSVLVYLEPVLVGLFAWMWLGEIMNWWKVLGLVLGFAGVASISIDSLAGHLSLIGTVIGIFTAIAWAIGTVYSKKVQGRTQMLWLLAIQFLLGGAVLTGAGSLTESWAAITWNGPFLFGTLYASLFGIAASWSIWFSLVHEGEASRVAAFTFFVPMISVLVATLFLHEPFTPKLVIGLVAIVLGIYLVNRKVKKPNLKQSAEVTERRSEASCN
ncbi:DMT family transporter [Alicyclobacillus sp. SO9]|uniref:DMT family transporter n=1 Tax=Alicyclobacillus sp. SO9 TaxID=2665646 RepID=UPI0018E71734|nr:DMT family transporter [Alicyclobacillus sp. SO9]QQE79352.1 DMT family transporter [Alicyclobacillus sp. SO9]